jgi:hypothetical protein
MAKTEHNDLVIIKLVDGNFAIGIFAVIEEAAFVTDAYSLIMRHTPSGEVAVAITDFMAPFINDGQGVTFSQYDWFGPAMPMPESLKSDYIQRKTGIRLATQMPQTGTGGGIIL